MLEYRSSGNNGEFRQQVVREQRQNDGFPSPSQHKSTGSKTQFKIANATATATAHGVAPKSPSPSCRLPESIHPEDRRSPMAASICSDANGERSETSPLAHIGPSTEKHDFDPPSSVCLESLPSLALELENISTAKPKKDQHNAAQADERYDNLSKKSSGEAACVDGGSVGGKKKDDTFEGMTAMFDVDRSVWKW